VLQFRRVHCLWQPSATVVCCKPYYLRGCRLQRRRMLVSNVPCAMLRRNSNLDIPSHGNCYEPGTVCCDFPSIQCTVGTLCNACSPGQTCDNNQCAGSPSSSATSSLTSLATTSSTATSSSLASSVTMTSTPTPTVVPSVGLYVKTGCFVDSISARVLSGQNSTDQSPTGMTVEKCVALAQQGSYAYAGVEYGG
jgi:hypothetical protein